MNKRYFYPFKPLFKFINFYIKLLHINKKLIMDPARKEKDSQ